MIMEWQLYIKYIHTLIINKTKKKCPKIYFPQKDEVNHTIQIIKKNCYEEKKKYLKKIYYTNDKEESIKI